MDTEEQRVSETQPTMASALPASADSTSHSASGSTSGLTSAARRRRRRRGRSGHGTGQPNVDTSSSSSQRGSKPSLAAASGSASSNVASSAAHDMDNLSGDESPGDSVDGGGSVHGANGTQANAASKKVKKKKKKKKKKKRKKGKGSAGAAAGAEQTNGKRGHFLDEPLVIKTSSKDNLTEFSGSITIDHFSWRPDTFYTRKFLFAGDWWQITVGRRGKLTNGEGIALYLKNHSMWSDPNYFSWGCWIYFNLVVVNQTGDTEDIEGATTYHLKREDNRWDVGWRCLLRHDQLNQGFLVNDRLVLRVQIAVPVLSCTHFQRYDHKEHVFKYLDLDKNIVTDLEPARFLPIRYQEVVDKGEHYYVDVFTRHRATDPLDLATYGFVPFFPHSFTISRVTSHSVTCVWKLVNIDKLWKLNAGQWIGSPFFIRRGHMWRLRLYPHGDGVSAHMSLYVENVTVKNQKTFFARCNFQFTVVNRRNAKKSITQKGFHHFDSSSHRKGFRKMAPLASLFFEKGFMEADTLELACKLQADSNWHLKVSLLSPANALDVDLEIPKPSLFELEPQKGFAALCHAVDNRWGIPSSRQLYWAVQTRPNDTQRPMTYLGSALQLQFHDREDGKEQSIIERLGTQYIAVADASPSCKDVFDFSKQWDPKLCPSLVSPLPHNSADRNAASAGAHSSVALPSALNGQDSELLGPMSSSTDTAVSHAVLLLLKSFQAPDQLRWVGARVFDRQSSLQHVIRAVVGSMQWEDTDVSARYRVFHEVIAVQGKVMELPGHMSLVDLDLVSGDILVVQREVAPAGTLSAASSSADSFARGSAFFGQLGLDMSPLHSHFDSTEAATGKDVAVRNSAVQRVSAKRSAAQGQPDEHKVSAGLFLLYLARVLNGTEAKRQAGADSGGAVAALQRKAAAEMALEALARHHEWMGSDQATQVVSVVPEPEKKAPAKAQPVARSANSSSSSESNSASPAAQQKKQRASSGSMDNKANAQSASKPSQTGDAKAPNTTGDKNGKGNGNAHGTRKLTKAERKAARKAKAKAANANGRPPANTSPSGGKGKKETPTQETQPPSKKAQPSKPPAKASEESSKKATEDATGTNKTKAASKPKQAKAKAQPKGGGQSKGKSKSKVVRSTEVKVASVITTNNESAGNERSVSAAPDKQPQQQQAKKAQQQARGGSPKRQRAHKQNKTKKEDPNASARRDREKRNRETDNRLCEIEARLGIPIVGRCACSECPRPSRHIPKTHACMVLRCSNGCTMRYHHPQCWGLATPGQRMALSRTDACLKRSCAGTVDELFLEQDGKVQRLFVAATSSSSTSRKPDVSNTHSTGYSSAVKGVPNARGNRSGAKQPATRSASSTRGAPANTGNGATQPQDRTAKTTKPSRPGQRAAPAEVATRATPSQNASSAKAKKRGARNAPAVAGSASTASAAKRTSPSKPDTHTHVARTSARATGSQARQTDTKQPASGAKAHDPNAKGNATVAGSTSARRSRASSAARPSSASPPKKAPQQWAKLKQRDARPGGGRSSASASSSVGSSSSSRGTSQSRLPSSSSSSSSSVSSSSSSSSSSASSSGGNSRKLGASNVPRVLRRQDNGPRTPYIPHHGRNQYAPRAQNNTMPRPYHMQAQYSPGPSAGSHMAAMAHIQSARSPSPLAPQQHMYYMGQQGYPPAVPPHHLFRSDMPQGQRGGQHANVPYHGGPWGWSGQQPPGQNPPFLAPQGPAWANSSMPNNHPRNQPTPSSSSKYSRAMRSASSSRGRSRSRGPTPELRAVTPNGSDAASRGSASPTVDEDEAAIQAALGLTSSGPAITSPPRRVSKVHRSASPTPALLLLGLSPSTTAGQLGFWLGLNPQVHLPDMRLLRSNADGLCALLVFQHVEHAQQALSFFSESQIKDFASIRPHFAAYPPRIDELPANSGHSPELLTTSGSSSSSGTRAAASSSNGTNKGRQASPSSNNASPSSASASPDRAANHTPALRHFVAAPILAGWSSISATSTATANTWSATGGTWAPPTSSMEPNGSNDGWDREQAQDVADQGGGGWDSSTA